jgi:hypothetical protein
MSSKIRQLWEDFESSGVPWSKIDYEDEDEDDFWKGDECELGRDGVLEGRPGQRLCRS